MVDENGFRILGHSNSAEWLLPRFLEFGTFQGSIRSKKAESFGNVPKNAQAGLEDCPHCLQSGGPDNVKERGSAVT